MFLCKHTTYNSLLQVFRNKEFFFSDKKVRHKTQIGKQG